MEKSTLALNQALSIFSDNLTDVRQACVDNAQALIAEYTPYKELDVDQEITEEAIILHVQWLYLQEHCMPLLNTVRRIDSYRYHTDPKNQNTNFITDLDIQTAKEAPAEWFIQEANLSTRKPHKGICPFHADRSPSLHLMKSKNGTLYLKCFACSWYGDSIKYIQDRDNLDFMEAVKRVIC